LGHNKGQNKENFEKPSAPEPQGQIQPNLVGNMLRGIRSWPHLGLNEGAK